jgi:hypothetical protein
MRHAVSGCVWLLSIGATAFGFGPLGVARNAVSVRRGSAMRMESSLEDWLSTKAGISPKFVGKVLETCEEEVRDALAGHPVHCTRSQRVCLCVR